MSLEEAKSFTSDQVSGAIKSCRSSIAYGPDFLNIFTGRTKDPSLQFTSQHSTMTLLSCRLPSIWKTSLVIPNPKPGKNSSQGTSYRHISLLCPAGKVPEALIIPSSTNFSYQLKINTASDTDTRLHLPSSSSQQTSRQGSTSGNHLTVQCVWP